MLLHLGLGPVRLTTCQRVWKYDTLHLIARGAILLEMPTSMIFNLIAMCRRQHSVMIIVAPLLAASLLGMKAPLPFATAAILETDANLEDGEGGGGTALEIEQFQGRGDNDRVDEMRKKFGLKNFVMNYDTFIENGVWAEGLNFRDHKQMRIIGGREARPHQYSFTVGLTDRVFGLFCGGSLITKDVVLTAAHCQGLPYNIVIGRHNLRDRNVGETIGVRRELPNPDYDPEKTDNDFMLVFLDRATTENVDVIKLNDDASIPRENDASTVLGWGDTDIDPYVTELSDVLLEVDANVISNDECNNRSGTIDGQSLSYKGHITSNMLCAMGQAEGQDSCQGDSGGPLIIFNGEENVQVGVVSWGIGCASKHFPGVYARVSRAHNWIEREVCSGSEYASEAGFDCGDDSGENSDDTPTTNEPSKMPTTYTPSYTFPPAYFWSPLPTYFPAYVSTFSPTLPPTPEHSRQPSDKPHSEEPTSRSSTNVPSRQPSSKPESEEPTSRSSINVLSRQPSSKPESEEPTSRSSTNMLSRQPSSKTGSEEPTSRSSTNVLSRQPSSKPESEEPTSRSSTNVLSRQPSSKPESEEPTSRSSTNMPSRQPSRKAGSEEPTSRSANMPSRQPSNKPESEEPSFRSTNGPSGIPSTNEPSKVPTTYPHSYTDIPTYFPSYLLPTYFPTYVPTFSPTLLPTSEPSRQPSDKPHSEEPMPRPSTNVPSRQPSSKPESEEPTSSSTNMPSIQPSSKTESEEPTSRSTNMPSRQPSNKPESEEPTSRSTNGPSGNSTRNTGSKEPRRIEPSDNNGPSNNEKSGCTISRNYSMVTFGTLIIAIYLAVLR